MSSSRTRWLRLLAMPLAAATLSLAACSGASGSSSASASAASGSSDAKATITFWNEMTGPYKIALDGEIKNFEAAHPNITVNDVVIPNDAALEPKLLAGIVGHSLPTISQLNPQWAYHFIQTNTLSDLTPQIKSAKDFGLSEFYPKMLQAGQWPGNKQYLLPFNVSDSIMLYNQNAFKAAGITAPPATWDQFKADAAKLSGGDKHAYAITLVHSYPWRAFFYGAGGKLTDSNGQPDKASLSASGAAGAAMSLWSDMIKQGSAMMTQGYATDTDFGNQTATIDIGTSAQYPYLVQDAAGKFTVAAAPMPKGTTNATSIFGGYLGIFSQASAAQKAAAFTFLQYLTSKTGQVYWLEHSQGYLPVRKDAATAAASFLNAHPAQKVALSQLDVAVPEPQYPWYDQFDHQNLVPTIQAVMGGTQTPSSGADSLYKAAVSAVAAK